MSKAAKLILVVLSVLLGISVYVVLNTLNQKENLEKTNKTLQDRIQDTESLQLKTANEKKLLEQEKTNLESQLKQAQDAKAGVQKKLDEAREQAAKIENKLNSLNSQVKDLTTERDDWKERVDAIKKERDDVMTKLEEVSAQLTAKESELQASSTAGAAQPQASAAPPAGVSDDQVAGVYKEKAALEVNLKELQDQLSKNVMETSDLDKKSSDLELELTTLKSEKTDLERKLKYSEDIANNLSLELARFKNDRKMGNNQLGQLQQDNEDLRAQIRSLTSSKAALEKSIVHISENKNAIEHKLDETKNLIQERVDEMAKLKESVDQNLETGSKQAQFGSKEIELQPIVVSATGLVVDRSPAEYQHSYSGFQGHVVTVNESDNFVIVDIGENSGLNIGDQLKVYHGAKSVAGLRIVQVRREIAAADIIEKKSSIKVGDIVR